MCLLLALCACRANVGPRSLIRGADVRFSNASCSEQIYGSAVAGNPSHAPLRDGTCGFYANSDIQTGLPLPRIASNNQQQCCQVCQNDPKCDGAVQAWGYCYPKTNIAMATVAKDQNTAILMYVPKTSFVAYAEADNPGDPLSTVENCSMIARMNVRRTSDAAVRCFLALRHRARSNKTLTCPKTRLHREM